jgi:hypothetical protein
MQVSIMAVELETKHEERKDDVVKLLILLFIASLLGVYLIATTVLISKDGVFYIGQAHKFSSDPIGIIKTHPPGYPFLILVAHKFVTLFTNTSSLFIWIYSAQSIALLCRLLGLIPLYFIGKWLVGSKKSFYAMLILILLTICLSKLLRPAGADKQGFRTAATWLKNNTGREDIVAIPDRAWTLSKRPSASARPFFTLSSAEKNTAVSFRMTTPETFIRIDENIAQGC